MDSGIHEINEIIWVGFDTNCSQIALKLLSYCSQIALKLLSNCSQIALKLLSNCSQIALILLPNCSQIALKLLSNRSQIALKSLSNCSQIDVKSLSNRCQIALKLLSSLISQRPGAFKKTFMKTGTSLRPAAVTPHREAAAARCRAAHPANHRPPERSLAKVVSKTLPSIQPRDSHRNETRRYRQSTQALPCVDWGPRCPARHVRGAPARPRPSPPCSV